jgi:hypothetical protein
MKNLIKHAAYMAGTFIVPAVIATSVNAQEPAQPATKKTMKIAANPHYDRAGNTKRWLWGKHYRKDWAAYTDIEILDMAKEAGGLTPVKLGGGLQTKSLRLKGANGKEYVLRTIDKDPSQAIAAELRGTVAEDIVQDQISSANPYAPIIVSALAEWAGIPQSKPRLVFVPRTDGLGEFSYLFGATLCLLEERPSTSEDGAKKVINTQKLLEKVIANADHKVDERGYLKARLFDMLIGDWDRHEDQWLWSSFEVRGTTFYQPIPRDRDQAFSSMDGVIPQMMTRKWGIRKIQHFDYTIRDIAGLNFAGIHLDKSFTTRLTFEDWSSVAMELQFQLTDAAIDAACSRVPANIYELSGKTIAAKLKRRRDDLQKYAKEYYSFISKEINIRGSKEKNHFEVTRNDNDQLDVKVYKIDGDRQSHVVYQRTFHKSETKEIRLYGMESDDLFSIGGDSRNGILVRVIGGKGTDSLSDLSAKNGLKRNTYLYDDSAKLLAGKKNVKQFIGHDTLKNDYHFRSYKFDWLAPLQTPGYNPDDGFYIGGGVVFKKQAFGKAPYAAMHTLTANYAFKTGAYNFNYQGIFKEALGKWDWHLDAQVQAPNYVRNYYGLGNETEKLDDVAKNYYRIRFNQIMISSALQRQFGKHHLVTIGSDYQSVKVENNDDRFISSENSLLDSADFGRKHYVRSQVAYQFNTLDNAIYPRKGVKVSTGIRFTQNTNENDRHFANWYTEISSFISKGSFTLASRTGVATNLGNEYEFFQANTLGGMSNLRGYRRDRFAGKTSLYQNTELRWKAGNFNAYITKGAWGLLGFVDRGKVWMPDVDSDTWHYGYGGGVWFMPFNKLALSATYGVSKEDNLVNISAGFLF